MGFGTLVDGKQVVAVVCNQWGDSGKGKLVDVLAEWADIIARGTGGPNAGHTVRLGDKTYIFHMIPSGILYDSLGKTNVMGNGMVLDLEGVCHELDMLESNGFSYENLIISDSADVILPQHKLRDGASFQSMAQGSIGSTGRGIGPAYADKIQRTGIKLRHLFNEDTFVNKLRENLSFYPELQMTIEEIVSKHVEYFVQVAKHTGIQLDQEVVYIELLKLMTDSLPRRLVNGRKLCIEDIIEIQLYSFERLKPLVRDTQNYMQRSLSLGKKILLEGAQGLLLSIEFGTTPYTTSSDCSIIGTAQGVGLNPNIVDLVLGIVKAPYMTRVGNGPFPTEFGGAESEKYCAMGSQHNQDFERSTYPDLHALLRGREFQQGIYARIVGDEYGATTGRPRRTGWLDLVTLSYAAAINKSRRGQPSDIIITKPDVMNGFDTIKLCTGYKFHGIPVDGFPRDSNMLYQCKPRYLEMPGWKQDIRGITQFKDLPQALWDIFQTIEDMTNTRIRIVSTGPDRDETIYR